MQAMRQQINPPLERRNAGFELLASGLSATEMERLAALFERRRQYRRNATLYRAQESSPSLFLIRSGSCKTTSFLWDGRGQVTGYFIAGDIVGLDGFAHARYTGDAVAVEHSEVNIVDLDALEELAQSSPTLQDNLLRLLSAFMVREQRGVLQLGEVTAKGRVANFLLELAKRYHCLGYSRVQFTLQLTGADLASLLGMTQETVSRAFASLEEMGLLQKRGRSIRLLDSSALNAIP